LLNAHGEIMSQQIPNKFSGLVSSILISFFNSLINLELILDAVILDPAL